MYLGWGYANIINPISKSVNRGAARPRHRDFVEVYQ